MNYIEGAAAKVNIFNLRMFALIDLHDGFQAWSYVHVVDIASFYLLALRKALDGTLETGPKRGNYFLEGGSLTWGVSANALASYMHAKGLVDSPSASAWTVEEASPELGFPAAFTNVLWGSHAVVQGTHSRQLGWTPKYTVDWLVQNLQTELDQI